MNDVAELNEQIARIKGCQFGGPATCPVERMYMTGAVQAHCPGYEHRMEVSSGGLIYEFSTPDYTQPAMWAGLLVELAAFGTVEIMQLGPKWFVGLRGDWLRDGETQPDIGLAVCRAYVTAHLPAEAQAKGEGR